MMMSIDSTIVATALHDIQQSLGAPINWAAWTITAYSLGFLLMLPVSGKLNERFGHRRVFIGSVVAFTLASLCCGLVDNIYLLVALRAVQAAGGAGFTPSATGIIVDHFGSARDRAVSLFGSIFPIGAMIGPIFGGLFVNYWSWRGIFLINIPIGIVVLIMAWRYLPSDRAGSMVKEPMDPAGLALLGVGLVTAMLATSYMGGPDASVTSWLFVVPVLVGIAAIWIFMQHINGREFPFIAPQFIHGKGFGAVNIINVLYGGIGSGAIILVPLYAINRYGLDALSAGTLLIAQGAASVVFSVIGALAIRRTGYRWPILAGGVVTVIGIALLVPGPQFGLTPYAWLAATTFLVGCGRGFMNPATRNAGLQLAPRRASTIAALRSMTLQFGSISTVSVATAVMAGAASASGAQASFYLISALILLAILPFIKFIPEHRGAW